MEGKIGMYTTHMCTDIQGFLNAFKRRNIDDIVTDDDGNLLKSKEAKELLQKALDNGEKVMKSSDECKYFDKQEGCKCKDHKRFILIDVTNGEGYSSPIVEEVKEEDINDSILEHINSYGSLAYILKKEEGYVSLEYNHGDDGAGIWIAETNDFNQMLLKIMPDVCEVEIISINTDQEKLLKEMTELIKEGEFEEDDLKEFFESPDDLYQFGSHDNELGYIHYEII